MIVELKHNTLVWFDGSGNGPFETIAEVRRVLGVSDHLGDDHIVWKMNVHYTSHSSSNVIDLDRAPRRSESILDQTARRKEGVMILDFV